MIIHGLSHQGIKYFRDNPASLSVYWIYVSRTNRDGVAFPSLRKLALDTDWSVPTIQKARKWLVEHEALEEVKGYVRPEWRDLEPDLLRKVLGLDQSEYYHPTGYFVVDGKKYWMLYFPGETPSSIDEDNTQEVKNKTTLTKNTRDPIWDNVVELIFGIADSSKIPKTKSGRIGQITSWLKGNHTKGMRDKGAPQLEQPATADEIPAFLEKYFMKYGADAIPPRDIGKFAEHFLWYRSLTTKSKEDKPAPYTPKPAAKPTKDQLAALAEVADEFSGKRPI